ncbi:hypothetical protein LBMAG25_09470 [Bacteroidota bacterium]|nr:hypothetical protein LBMAG25_09470 [Bacteroidota bacterium]
MLKKVILVLVVLFILLQFFQIDKSNPFSELSNDFFQIQNTPKELSATIEEACYDCHSYKTEFPWYTSVQPIAWWINHHINEGRDELNFSDWGNYSSDKKKKLSEECSEKIIQGKMPLSSYTYMHNIRIKDPKQRQLLANYFSSLQFNTVRQEQEQEQEYE